jgi:hypothetical protein
MYAHGVIRDVNPLLLLRLSAGNASRSTEPIPTPENVEDKLDQLGP